MSRPTGGTNEQDELKHLKAVHHFCFVLLSKKEREGEKKHLNCLHQKILIKNASHDQKVFFPLFGNYMPNQNTELLLVFTPQSFKIKNALENNGGTQNKNKYL